MEFAIWVEINEAIREKISAHMQECVAAWKIAMKQRNNRIALKIENDRERDRIKLNVTHGMRFLFQRMRKGRLKHDEEISILMSHRKTYRKEIIWCNLYKKLENL